MLNTSDRRFKFKSRFLLFAERQVSSNCEGIRQKRICDICFSYPHTEICVIPPPENSTLVPPTGFSLSEDVDATPSFILTEYDLDPRVLRGCYEGLKSPKKVRTIDKISKAPIQISGVVTRG